MEAPNVVDTVGAFNFSSSNYSFLDFPFEDTSNFTYGVTDYSEGFVDGGQRWGYIVNGYKQGIWTTGSREFDSLGHLLSVKVFRLEYFRDGLRDGIFNLYNNGRIFYSTSFKNGTGLLKAFYGNGQLYYEIETVNGYFADTLRLYSDEGMLREKLLYIKDSLVFHQILVRE